MRYVGKRIPRVDAYSKVSGESVYGADLQLENVNFIKVFRSPYPHAYILEIDESEALRMEGVLAVITSKDIPGENLCGKIKRDQPILADGKVRHIGEPIAAVVAKTEVIAQKAVDSIKVDYELLTPVFSPEDALKSNAPNVHNGSNLLREFHIFRGDIETGFSKADIVIENIYTTPLVEHAYIEPEAGIAKVDSEGRIWVYASAQYPHHIAREICQILSLPPEKVRIVQAMMGGGFGGKIDISVHGILALAVYKTKKPVKWIYTREESFLVTTKRHPFIIQYRTGAKKNGELTAADVDILLDTGGYASSGPAVATRAGIFAIGPYNVPSVRVRSRAVYTNNPIAGAMRGFGGPQVAFAHESQMDILAEKLGMDPYHIRKVNIFHKGSRTITGQLLKESVGMKKTLEAAHMKLCKTMDSNDTELKLYCKRGIGYGCGFHGVGNTGVPNYSEVRIKLTDNGKILILVGASELGQGLLTAFQQIASQALGISFEKIEVQTEDTFFTADPEITSASKQTYMTGNAICQAASNLVKEVSALIAKQFQISPEKVVYSGGVFSIITNGEDIVTIPIYDVASSISSQEVLNIEVIGSFASETIPLDQETGQGVPYPTYSFATQIAEVDVDTRTGQIRVNKIISATDVGRAINPDTVEGQILGGAVMGLGYAVMEEYVPGLTRNFGEYLIPTSCDNPRIYPIIIEDREPSGPFGAKGMGEIVSVPTAAAIANAVNNAIGIRFYQLPLIPERVHEALKKRKKE